MQVVSLFPLFPGTNEMDQIEKIHAIMGTPPPEVLARMKKHSTHIEYDFNPKVGSSHACTHELGYQAVLGCIFVISKCVLFPAGAAVWPWSQGPLLAALDPHGVQL